MSELQVQDLYGDGLRIPDINVAPDGTVLALGESGRQIRRSTDRGQTWSPAAEIAADAGGSTVVDTVTGDVLLVQPRAGRLWRSRDCGVTWEGEDITVEANPYGHGAPGKVPVLVNCSESGLTLQHGEYAGRLLMPGRCQPPNGNNDQEWWPYNYNTSVFSDDRGRTWRVGDPVQGGTGEGTLAELSDGRVYYNSRCHMAVDHRRRIAWSHDGGKMWVDWQVSEWLYEIGEPFYFKYGSKPSYGCNAGLARLPLGATDGRDVLVYSAPDNPGGHRLRMTVWASFDGARTWPVKRLVDEGISAYSSITAGPDGTCYLLYERAEEELYEKIAVAVFDLDWLCEGKDWRTFSSD